MNSNAGTTPASGILPSAIPPVFVEFPKMARLSREVIITEKIDGTNAQVLITEHGDVFAGSRTRWITPAADNFGFAAWVEAHRQELLALGPGRHYGEWWGQGIQRGYWLKEKRFSLFNVTRWCSFISEPRQIPTADPRIVKMQERAPECCYVVPELWRGVFSTDIVNDFLSALANDGSVAVPGFMRPEGIVVYHVAASVGFKKTIEKDDEPKSKQRLTDAEAQP